MARIVLVLYCFHFFSHKMDSGALSGTGPGKKKARGEKSNLPTEARECRSLPLTLKLGR